MPSAKKTVAQRVAPAPARRQAPVSAPRSAGRGDKPRGMRSVNRVVLLGALGQDAETRYTQSGTAVTQFSVATNRSWKDGDNWKEETQWTRVVMWAQEKTAEYLTKGKKVYIEGRLSTRSYEDRDGKTVWATEVVTDQVILLSGVSDGQEQSQPRGQRDQISEDDIPF